MNIKNNPEREKNKDAFMNQIIKINDMIREVIESTFFVLSQ